MLRKQFRSTVRITKITVIYNSTCLENTSPWLYYSPSYTSPSSTMATLLAIHLTVVMQSFGYFVFHDENTLIQLGLSWQSHFCQCLNTKTSAQDNRGYTTETPNIFYSRNLYIRLVVIL